MTARCSTITLAFSLSVMFSLTCCAGVPELQLKDRLDGSREPVRIAAHRGASAIAPENTSAAVAAAIDARADLIEFDVRVTTDGELLLFHDKTLERYGGGKKIFAELSSAEALLIDVGSFFGASFASERPPVFAATVQQCLDGGCIPLIEHKTGAAAAYSKVLHDLDALDEVVVQSFDWKFLAELRALEPGIKLGALGEGAVDAAVLEKIAVFSPAMVGWKNDDITTPAIEAFHQAGYAVAIWTVNDERRMKALAASGIDIIITDKPAEAKAALSQQ